MKNLSVEDFGLENSVTISTCKSLLVPFEKCAVLGATKMSVTVKNSNTVSIIIWDDNSLNLNKEFTSNTKNIQSQNIQILTLDMILVRSSRTSFRVTFL